MFKPFLLSLVIVAGLAGCETVGPTKSDLSSLSEGKTGAVMLDYEEFDGLYSYHVYIANREASKVIRLLGSNNPEGWVKGNLALNTVVPGTYEIVEGGLANYDTSASMPLLKFWFEPFEVKAGELVDLGKLVMERIEVSSIQKQSEGLVGKLLGLKDSERDATFIVYRFDGADAQRDARLLEKTPEISKLDRVRRSPKARFTRAEFETAVLRAYAPNAEGLSPKDEAAKKILSESLAELIFKKSNDGS